MMSKKVLIVEDNELNMKLFHDLLDSQGYETLQTREGLQALALARLHKPDLILMDIQSSSSPACRGCCSGCGPGAGVTTRWHSGPPRG